MLPSPAKLNKTTESIRISEVQLPKGCFKQPVCSSIGCWKQKAADDKKRLQLNGFTNDTAHKRSQGSRIAFCHNAARGNLNPRGVEYTGHLHVADNIGDFVFESSSSSDSDGSGNEVSAVGSPQHENRMCGTKSVPEREAVPQTRPDTAPGGSPSKATSPRRSRDSGRARSRFLLALARERRIPIGPTAPGRRELGARHIFSDTA